MEQEFRIKTFKEFWPYYMSEHRKPGTRRVHFVGTTIAFIFLVVYFVTFNIWYIPIGFVSVYGPAFLSHFLIEKNRPATFKYPFFSVGGDLKMWFLILIGKIKI
jgi:hypothetical protein